MTTTTNTTCDNPECAAEILDNQQHLTLRNEQKTVDWALREKVRTQPNPFLLGIESPAVVPRITVNSRGMHFCDEKCLSAWLRLA